jgi:hypothetical protein
MVQEEDSEYPTYLACRSNFPHVGLDFTMLLISAGIPPRDLFVDEGDTNFETMCYFLVMFRTADIGQNTEDKLI